MKKTTLPIFIFLLLCWPHLGCKDSNKGAKPDAKNKALDFAPIKKPVTDLVRVENIGQSIQKTFKQRFLGGIKDRKSKKISSALTEDFQGQILNPKSSDWVTESNIGLWSAHEAGGSISPREAFVKDVMSTFSTWAVIDLVDWHVFRIQADSSRPSSRAIIKGHLSLAGQTSERTREEIYATVTCELTRNERGHWRVSKMRFDDQTRARTTAKPFRDIAQVTGFQFNASEKNKRLQQSVINERHLFTSGGLTALDFDRDGFMDILATRDDQETILFHNDGRGGFKRKHLPLIDSPAKVSKFYAWVDLDNDGQEELVGERVLASSNGKHELGLYTFTKGKMNRVAGAMTFDSPKWLHKISFESIVPCDVNGDELLDLIFVGYSHNDSNRLPSFISATDGMRNLLFINKGDLRFEELGLKHGLAETKYSLVAACQDFDDDGDPDLFIGNDFGTNDYYENDGKGRFTASTSHPFYQGSSFSMGLSIADFDNTGDYAVSVSNMYSHAGNRIVPLAGEFEGHHPKDILRLASGNSLYEKVNGQYQDTGVERNIHVSGWAWGNQFLDIDNDGDRDLFVTNGNNTHTDARLPDF